jgi:CDP-diacylglycerol---glycerol-3-phosphate 3-phosphatidyltransferase
MTESTRPASPTAVSNFNLPNVLTALRIVMVPVFGYALLRDGGDSISWRIAAAVLFISAMVTDKVDGDIARKRNLVTNFGKIADPIADKALTGMAFVGLSLVGEVWWWVTLAVLVREWSVTALRLSLLRHVVLPAAYSGKVKTTLQVIALFGLTLPLPHGDPAESAFVVFGPGGTALFYAAQLALAGAVVATMWSGYEFFRDVYRTRRSR